jgi:hypothetical protein
MGTRSPACPALTPDPQAKLCARTWLLKQATQRTCFDAFFPPDGHPRPPSSEDSTNQLLEGVLQRIFAFAVG